MHLVKFCTRATRKKEARAAQADEVTDDHEADEPELEDDEPDAAQDEPEDAEDQEEADDDELDPDNDDYVTMTLWIQTTTVLRPLTPML
eukprot:3175391-Amphidinium_carterae.1